MATKIPSFTYTGAHTEQMIGDYWVIFLTTDGTLRFAYDHEIDVTVLGGGGSGGPGGVEDGSGGGGGYQTIKFGVSAAKATDYAVVVGKGGTSDAGPGNPGGQSKAFGITAEGGGGGEEGPSHSAWPKGGVGGTGNGASRDGTPGSNTVRAFGESSNVWPLYGGGGATDWNQAGGAPYGGDGDGGDAKGYGGGGGGGSGPVENEPYYSLGGKGYQGIVVIRGARDDQLPVKFSGTTLTRMVFDGSEVKHLIYNGTKLFMERMRRFENWSKPKTRFVLREA